MRTTSRSDTPKKKRTRSGPEIRRCEGCGAAYEQSRAIALQKEKEREAAKRSTFYFMFKNKTRVLARPKTFFFLKSKVRKQNKHPHF